MTLLDINGKPRNKSVNSYRIKWDGKSRSNIQFEVKQFFKRYWKSCLCFEEFPVYGTRMKVDIINATSKIAVEIHGGQHDEFNVFFHKNKLNWLASIKRDRQKYLWLELNGFKIIEIYEKEIKLISEKWVEEKFGLKLSTK